MSSDQSIGTAATARVNTPFITYNGLDPIKKAVLDKIPVGCLRDKTDGEVSRAMTFANKVPKLEVHNNGTTTFHSWVKMMEPTLRIFARNRAEGIIKDTAEGSVEAYQRYFGYPWTPRDGYDKAELLEYSLAKDQREQDDIQIGNIIIATLDRKVILSILDGSPEAGSGKALWKKIHARFLAKGPGARTMVNTALITYNSTNKSVETIINELRAIFEHWLMTVGTEIDEQDKVSHLLRVLPPHLSHFVAIVGDQLQRDGTVTFDDVARRALYQDQMRLNQEQQMQWRNAIPAMDTGNQVPRLAIGYSAQNSQLVPTVTDCLPALSIVL
ncbi:hypothetical protein BDZ90DRAFT_270074 [Jaminaea rosea]|uniref:Uncharacterized protein n=1 Tax=Jaminaea rosea TaxID=1569628 RepID=A0A316UVE2_9BASI|nr:hypothetical protein BDZ90DRAFT_270074 [Jaminaea rosea]PWN28758.1 hypothetical protein BDZ90DRAFT_270074 [Jaminaea rosea]